MVAVEQPHADCMPSTLKPLRCPPSSVDLVAAARAFAAAAAAALSDSEYDYSDPATVAVVESPPIAADRLDWMPAALHLHTGAEDVGSPGEISPFATCRVPPSPPSCYMPPVLHCQARSLPRHLQRLAATSPPRRTGVEEVNFPACRCFVKFIYIAGEMLHGLLSPVSTSAPFGPTESLLPGPPRPTSPASRFASSPWGCSRAYPYTRGEGACDTCTLSCM
uniref:Uncharacterized protein n=1 Tax=Arundo donax TaxID=35708 RepID=A0A0A9BKB2_ARUDO